MEDRIACRLPPVLRQLAQARRAFREAQLSRHLPLVERLKGEAEGLETTPGAVAVAWALRNSVDGAIVGFRRPIRSTRPSAPRFSSSGQEDVATIEGRV